MVVRIINSIKYRLVYLINKKSIKERQAKNLEKQLAELEKNPDKMWLYKNRSERMDATIKNNFLFEETRRKFHLARYEFACKYTYNKIVADIACGTGYGSKSIVEKGQAKKYLGIDIDLESIKYAKKYFKLNNTEFYNSNGESTSISNNSIDIILCFETIEHVSDEKKLLKEFKRILKKNGLLICSTPNKWPLEIAEHHVKEYDYKSFRNTLEDIGFTLENMYNQNSGTNWKYNHSQLAGIIETNKNNKSLAECFIAVCSLK